MKKIDLEEEIKNRLSKMFDDHAPERKERCIKRAEERNLFKELADQIQNLSK